MLETDVASVLPCVTLATLFGQRQLDCELPTVTVMVTRIPMWLVTCAEKEADASRQSIPVGPSTTRWGRSDHHAPSVDKGPDAELGSAA